jgi:hypothetical protein
VTSRRVKNIAAELLALRTAEGVISAPDAVRWARDNPQSALHGALTWDDAEAGQRYRIWQVRSLIAVHVVDANGGRAFVSLSVDRGAGGYRPLPEVLSRVDLRAVMLADALEDLERVQRKYERLAELTEVWAAKDKVARRRKPRDAAA